MNTLTLLQPIGILLEKTFPAGVGFFISDTTGIEMMTNRNCQTIGSIEVLGGKFL